MDSTPLADALRACRRHFVASALFSGLVNILYIAPTAYMLQVYDRVVPTQSLSTLLFLTVALVVALLTSSVLDGIRTRLLVRASVGLDHVFAPQLLDATLGRPELPVAHHALREFDTLRQTLTGPGVLALFDAPWTPIYLLICFLVHPLIGALSLLAMVVLPAIAWLNERATRARLERAHESSLASYILQDAVLAGAETVRALGMRRAMVSRQLRRRRLALQLQTDAGFAGGGFISASRLARQLLQSLALGLGALLAVNNQISAGAIFASSFLIGRAIAPVELLIASWRGLIQARASARNLSKLLISHATVHPATHHRPPRGALALEGVTVMNDTRSHAILQGITFSCRPGEMIAIVGPSGAGKSTLARVIAGARHPDRGTLRFDEIDSWHLDPERLGQHLGYLPQDSRLFPGTIKENICRFAEEDGGVNSRDEAAITAAELVGAHALIARLPQGYDQAIGLGGSGVSAGQAQRIALARAVYGNPALLVLDEPNAHLDAEGDHSLNVSLARLKEAGTTVLIVSHKLSMLPIVDRLLLLRDGKVEMFGPRDEVLARIAPPMPRVPQPVPTA